MQLGEARAEVDRAVPMTFLIGEGVSMALDALANIGPVELRLFVQNTRTISKRDLIHNDALPRIEVDPQTYEVRADSVLLTCEPATILPLAQRYFLF